MPSSMWKSRVMPLASGVPAVTEVTESVLLNPPPFGWLGGCSSVVPCTVTELVPLPHGGRSTTIDDEDDVRGRRSAKPEGAGNVVTSTTRNRSRVMLTPDVLV